MTVAGSGSLPRMKDKEDEAAGAKQLEIVE